MTKGSSFLYLCLGGGFWLLSPTEFYDPYALHMGTKDNPKEQLNGAVK